MKPSREVAGYAYTDKTSIKNANHSIIKRMPPPRSSPYIIFQHAHSPYKLEYPVKNIIEVIFLDKNTTGGLDRLLNQSGSAQQYFSSLPEYVQEMILQRRQSIQSEDDLRGYADNLTRGDG